MTTNPKHTDNTSLFWLALVLCCATFLLSQNTLLQILALTVLASGIKLLWRSGESPILFFVFLYQWLQVNTKTLHADVLGLNVQDVGNFGGDIHLAIVLGNGAMLAMSIGMNRGVGLSTRHSAELARSQALAVPLRRWLSLYMAGFAISLIALVAASLAPGFWQILLALSGIRWATFFVLTYACFSRKKFWWPWLLIFAGEYLLSLGGFFSEFRTILFFAIFGVVAALAGRFTLRKSLPLLMLTLILAVSALVWTSVKGEYRSYVNQSSGLQVVEVDRTAQLSKLRDLVDALDANALPAALEALAARLAYVDFFSRVMVVVPARTEHTDGEIWGDALLRIATPRLLFPEKTSVDDSRRTNQFTGLNLAGGESGTSISLGYVAESYIDFGMEFMFMPLLAFGYCIGRLYRWLHEDHRCEGLLGMGLASSSLIPIAAFEASITKSLPALALSALAAWGFLLLIWPRLRALVIDQSTGLSLLQKLESPAQ